MKKMLYAGAALMIGASVYGFVDYKRTSQKKEFKSMYVEEKKDPAPVIIDNKKVSVDKTELNEPVTIAKKDKKSKDRVKNEVKVSASRKFRLSEFSRGRIPDEEVFVEEKDGVVTDSIAVVHKK